MGPNPQDMKERRRRRTASKCTMLWFLMHLITKQDNEAAFVFNLIWTELIPACLSLVFHPSCSAHSAKCYTWPCQPPPLRRSSKGREGNLISAQIKIPTSHQLCNSRLGYRQHLVNYSPPFDIKYDSKTGESKNNAWQAQIPLRFLWNFRRNKSGLWKRSEWECLGALLCHETTYWWIQELTAKPQTGPLEPRGPSCWATKRLLLSANMVPRFSWSGSATQRANRCRQKRALELNLDLSVVAVTSITLPRPASYCIPCDDICLVISFDRP